MMIQEPNDGFLSIRSAAKYLDCSPWLIRRKIIEGHLTPYTLPGGRKLLLRKTDVDCLARPKEGSA